MVNKFLVQSEKDASFSGKRGLVEARELCLSDASGRGFLSQNPTYQLQGDELKAFANKLVQTVVEIEIEQFAFFGAQLQIKVGKIIRNGSE